MIPSFILPYIQSVKFPGSAFKICDASICTKPFLQLPLLSLVVCLVSVLQPKNTLTISINFCHIVLKTSSAHSRSLLAYKALWGLGLVIALTASFTRVPARVSLCAFDIIALVSDGFRMCQAHSTSGDLHLLCCLKFSFSRSSGDMILLSSNTNFPELFG